MTRKFLKIFVFSNLAVLAISGELIVAQNEGWPLDFRKKGSAYTVTSLGKTHEQIYTNERWKPVLDKHIKPFWEANARPVFLRRKPPWGHEKIKEIK